MPGLLRAVGRTAVVAGTATAVSNRVSRRQANRWSQQYDDQQPPPQQYAPPPQQYAQPPQQYAPPPQQYAQPEPIAAAPDPIEQLKGLAELRNQGVLTEAEFAAQKAKILGT